MRFTLPLTSRQKEKHPNNFYRDRPSMSLWSVPTPSPNNFNLFTCPLRRIRPLHLRSSFPSTQWHRCEPAPYWKANPVMMLDNDSDTKRQNVIFKAWECCNFWPAPLQELDKMLVDELTGDPLAPDNVVGRLLRDKVLEAAVEELPFVVFANVLDCRLDEVLVLRKNCFDQLP